MTKKGYRRCFVVTGLLAMMAAVPAYAQLTALQQQQKAYEQHYNTLSQQTSSAILQQGQAASYTIQAPGSSTPATPITPLTSASTNGQSTAATVAQPQVTSCDCYTQSDTYNLISSNFYYNEQGKRTYRIRPYCQCKPQSQSKQTVKPPALVVNLPPMPTPNASSTPSANNKQPASGSTSGQFNINYN